MQEISKNKLPHKRFLSILQVLIIFFRFWATDYKGMERQDSQPGKDF
jgi:hypothetical protein